MPILQESSYRSRFPSFQDFVISWILLSVVLVQTVSSQATLSYTILRVKKEWNPKSWSCSDKVSLNWSDSKL